MATFEHQPVHPVLDEPGDGAHIHRSMRLLADSSPCQRHSVKVLVYGQSVSAQDWWYHVRDDLSHRFPHADLIMENRSIGGFSAQYLIHSVEHDLYPWYPDLVIFRVLGDHCRYEDILARLRARTTADVLIWNAYTNNAQDKKDSWGTWFANTFVPTMCHKYKAQFVDSGRDWQRYLEAYDLDFMDFVLCPEDRHLNENGNWLLGEIIKRQLFYNPRATSYREQDLVRDFLVDRDLTWQDGCLEMDFSGNRVDVVAAAAVDGRDASAQVFIDGRKPSSFPELTVYSRCGGAIATQWPVVMNVKNEAPLVPEEWRMRFYDINDDVSFYRFEVEGSQTGPDGHGDNQHRFVSSSGRVIIEPDLWAVKRDYDLRKQRMPEGYEVTWCAYGLYRDHYHGPRDVLAHREHVVTLAQGLANEHHKLKIQAENQRVPAIKALRVYQPPFPEPTNVDYQEPPF